MTAPHTSDAQTDPDLPMNFSFLRPEVVAGCATPRWSRDMDAALAAMVRAGVGAVLSLDEEGLPEDALARHGLAYLHSPIPDFQAPPIPQVDQCLDFVELQLSVGNPVAIHCHAGLGRTGTLLACWLVRSEGMGATRAIAEVRRRRPDSIETHIQEQLIQNYCADLRRG